MIEDVALTQHSTCLTFAWCRQEHGLSATCTVREMSRLACGPYGNTALQSGDSTMAWAVRRPDLPSPLAGWSVYVNGNELCLVEGDFHTTPPGVRGEFGEVKGLAEEVARQLRANANERIKGLIGAWAGIYVDPRREKVLVFGDLTGTRPIFYFDSGPHFVVSSSLWSFRGCDAVERKWDRIALAQRMTLGVPLQGRTWFENVRILGRGQQVRAKRLGGLYVADQRQRYEREDWSHRESVRQLQAATDATLGSVASRTGDGLGIALSGGLDSRILLASLYRQNISSTAITYCHNINETEQLLAAKCANLTKTEHHAVVMDRALATSLISDCLLTNQGESRAYAHVMLGLDAAKLGIDAFLVGYPADLFAGHPGGDFSIQSVGSVDELSEKMLSIYLQWMKPEELNLALAPELRVEWSNVMDEWSDSFDRTTSSAIHDCYIDHILDYRVQRRTYPRVDQSRPWCTPIMVYIDERVYNVYRRLPLHEIVEEKAHIGVLNAYYSGLENIPSAAKAFLKLPLKYEFQARSLINLGRSVRKHVVRPLQQQRRRLANRRAPTTLPANVERMFDFLGGHNMFSKEGVAELRLRARRGEFSTTEVLQQLRCMATLHDFLFGDGLSAEDRPRALSPAGDLRWLDPVSIRATSAHQSPAQPITLHQRSERERR